MKDATVEYQNRHGVYWIDMYIDGQWECGGVTDCLTYDETYNYACKLAKTKGVRLNIFRKAGAK